MQTAITATTATTIPPATTAPAGAATAKAVKTVETTIEIGQAEFTFCAAHAGLHEAGFESLHGHTYEVTARLSGRCDPELGIVSDFEQVKARLREVIEPLKFRMLVATDTDRAKVERLGDRVRVSDPGRAWVFPVQDVVLLPVVNTSTEELARYLLEQLAARLPDWQRLTALELTVAEAPGVSATVHMELG